MGRPPRGAAGEARSASPGPKSNTDFRKMVPARSYALRLLGEDPDQHDINGNVIPIGKAESARMRGELPPGTNGSLVPFSVRSSESWPLSGAYRALPRCWWSGQSEN